MEGFKSAGIKDKEINCVAYEPEFLIRPYFSLNDVIKPWEFLPQISEKLLKLGTKLVNKLENSVLKN